MTLSDLARGIVEIAEQEGMVEIDQADEIEQLRAALLPLASIAELIDRRSVGGLRPDDATIWQANAQHRSACDLTMGHARAARAALEKQPK